VMALLALLSVLRGLDPVLVGDAWKAYLTAPPILFVAAEASEHPREVRSFLWWVLALTVLTAGGAIAQALIGIDLLARTGMNLGTGAVAFVSIDPVTGRFFQRVFSILDDQLALAAFSFCGIALSLLLAETTRRAGTRLLLLVLAGLNAYALLLTYNITVFLGTALFVFIHMCRKRSPRLLAGALILGLVVLGVAWLRYGDLVQNRLMTSFSVHSGVSTSLNSRLEANRQAWGMFRREPLVGGGLGSTASSMVYYRLGVRPDFIGGFATDNHYMTVALEAGLLGLAALLALHALPLWGLYRLRRRRLPGSGPFIAVAGSAVLVLLLMNFSNAPMNTNPSNLLFWILTGLIWRESARSPESPGKNLHDGARDEGGPLATDCLP
jgi:O-antigen ligase